MKTAIISGGKAPSKDILLETIKDADIIIGADKGCEVLYEVQHISKVHNRGF